MKKKKLVIGLFILFICLLSLTIYVSFSTNTTAQGILIKSMTPVYDETSTVEVDNNNVIFNDKNQIVKYNVLLENTQDYDVKISDIKLSTPTEEFLSYKVEGISADDVVEANSIKELTISFETMGIKGWGRNFADELTANISFEKIAKQEEVVPPVEEDKEEKQPEAPTTKIEEIVDKAEKIEVNTITNNTIEFKDGFKVEDASKVETWIYPETEFYGYKEVDESNTIKEIVLEKERLDELEITPGEHNIVISTEEKKVLGYVELYIDEDKEVLVEKKQDTTNKEDSTINNSSGSTPSIDKEETSKEENEKIENPYTSGNALLSILFIATGSTGLVVIILSKKKITKYTIFIIGLGTSLILTTGVRAERTIDIPITLNVSFVSQNVMKPSGWELDSDMNPLKMGVDHWMHIGQIIEVYIQNEIVEIDNYAYQYDVTNVQNRRVMAYLIEREDGRVCRSIEGAETPCYDLYLQADGVIYPNPDASYYFFMMINLESINNIIGLDTSNVTNMNNMFAYTGSSTKNLTLDLSNLDTSSVTDMSYMFYETGHFSETFALDLSNLDTSNVTNMNNMFAYTGSSTKNLTLDLSNLDTSSVTDMSYMFYETGNSSENFALDLSSFDTSNVTDMSYMFYETGNSSENFALDLSSFDTSNVSDMNHMFKGTGSNSQELTLNFGDKFDTSNVTDMRAMFFATGHNSQNFTLDLSSFDTSNVRDMGDMFYATGYSSQNFTLDLSNFDTSKVTDMSYMFYRTGAFSENFALDLSSFDTSKVTNMSNMFSETGYSSENFTLDLSSFDTSNVTNMSSMFYGAGYNDENFTLDVSNFDTSNVTNMGAMFSSTGFNSSNFTLDLSSFDTSKVTNMSNMFCKTGYNSTNFTLDLSSFDTSNVTNMNGMFIDVGYESTKFNTEITIKNPNTSEYYNMFNRVAIKEGTLMKVNYTSKTSLLVDKMIATKTKNANVVKGELVIMITDEISVGDEIAIGSEHFNVISQTDDTITMLAQKNLSPEYRQSATENRLLFAKVNGWDYTPGPKEIDIAEWSTDIFELVNGYVEYLKQELNDETVTGNLITLKELKALGCTISDDYSYTSGFNCANSAYKSWLLNNQHWWTRSAISNYSYCVWTVLAGGNLNSDTYYTDTGFSVRPTITISKETLKNLG